jgi:hypothetical protein
VSRSSKGLNYLLPSAYFKVKGMKLHKYNDAPVGFRSINLATLTPGESVYRTDPERKESIYRSYQEGLKRRRG